MKRLLDVSVSILVVIALFMSQSWAVTAAYADYSIDGSDDSNSFHLEGSTSNQAEPISGGQESDAGSVDSEPQDAQQVLSGETNEAAAADSASNDQLTVKNVSVSAHVQNIGWMDPVSSGKVAGTTGRGLNLEALKISLEVDGATSQEQIANAISVEAHVSNVGWQAAVGNGGTAGTTGQSRAVEAIAAEVSSPVSGGLSYSAHVSGVGWQDEVSGGAVAGTTGQGRAVECVKMRLTGDLSEYYDVWYRAYVQDYGWLGWAGDGARAGTTGIGYRVEALQVRVLAKGSAAPGPTDGAYRDVADEKVIGVPRIRLVTWLTQHQYDGYYLGTPYSTGFSIPTCTYPNGERRWDGYSGMNCTGFVAHAWSKCGGNLAAVAANNSHSPWAGGPGGGGYINAWRFYGYAIDSGSKVYEFNKVQDLLNSGLARKGDVIFFKTAPNVDCHIGFFWGVNPRDNKMWHSSSPANQISSIYNYSNPAEINQHVCLIK